MCSKAWNHFLRFVSIHSCAQAAAAVSTRHAQSCAPVSVCPGRRAGADRRSTQRGRGSWSVQACGAPAAASRAAAAWRRGGAHPAAPRRLRSLCRLHRRQRLEQVGHVGTQRVVRLPHRCAARARQAAINSCALGRQHNTRHRPERCTATSWPPRRQGRREPQQRAPGQPWLHEQEAEKANWYGGRTEHLFVPYPVVTQSEIGRPMGNRKIGKRRFRLQRARERSSRKPLAAPRGVLLCDARRACR